MAILILFTNIYFKICISNICYLKPGSLMEPQPKQAGSIVVSEPLLCTDFQKCNVVDINKTMLSASNFLFSQEMVARSLLQTD